jgi:transcriptional regulator with XRE-family HTH domain
MHHVIVDPRFAARLRELRSAAGLSLRDLSRSAYLGKSTLSELENGRTVPSMETAAHLDDVLSAGGELAGMVAERQPAPAEQVERVEYALTHPAAVDRAAVEALTDVLAAHRRLDDALDSRLLLPAVRAERATLLGLADAVRGPQATAVRRLAAEWTLFSGWLHAESRHDGAAVRLLADAADAADELDDGHLAAQAADFCGYVARQAGRHRATIRWCLSAHHTAGAAELQRAMNAAHAAGGYARLGDRQEAQRLLAAATDLAEAADGPAPPVAYWLTRQFIHLGIGVAWLGLGDRPRAADHLRNGLGSLPDGHAEAEWAAEYREALASAVQ